jgi:predicted O-methyltransferase YrrM
VVVPHAVAAYLRDLARVEDPVLREMHELAEDEGFPIVGPEVGRFLFQVARILRARRIFELGSGFGYSTLWFAWGAEENAEIHHTDADSQNTERAREFLERAGVADRVVFHTADALETLQSTKGDFDILFCDVDKHDYPEVAERFRRRVRVGGALITDNLLWSGEVAKERPAKQGTEEIREYTRAMWADPDFQSSLLPLRDGVGFHVRLR